MVQLLVKAGAKASALTPAILKPRRDNTIRNAVRDSIPLLQRADASFSKGSGWISCHDNSLTAMTVGSARKRGVRIDGQTAR